MPNQGSTDLRLDVPGQDNTGYIADRTASVLGTVAVPMMPFSKALIEVETKLPL